MRPARFSFLSLICGLLLAFTQPSIAAPRPQEGGQAKSSQTGQTNQDNQAEAPSPTVEAQTAAPVKWFFTYEGKPAGELAAAPQFAPTLKHYFPSVLVKFWSTQSQNKYVPDVAAKFLAGKPDLVRVDENRYVIASGCLESFCADRGLLWVDAHIDTTTSQPTLVFAALDVREGSSRLWVFSNHDFYDNPFTIPQDLRVNITRWLGLKKPVAVKRVDEAILVDPAGDQQMDVEPAILGVPLSMINLNRP